MNPAVVLGGVFGFKTLIFGLVLPSMFLLARKVASSVGGLGVGAFIAGAASLGMTILIVGPVGSPAELIGVLYLTFTATSFSTVSLTTWGS